MEDENNNVNHPVHYQTESGLEVIEVIEAFELGYKMGSVIKYTLRARKKGNYVEDLQKARWFLDRLIVAEKEKKRKQVANKTLGNCPDCGNKDEFCSLHI